MPVYRRPPDIRPSRPSVTILSSPATVQASLAILDVALFPATPAAGATVAARTAVADPIRFIAGAGVPTIVSATLAVVAPFGRSATTIITPPVVVTATLAVISPAGILATPKAGATLAATLAVLDPVRFSALAFLAPTLTPLPDASFTVPLDLTRWTIDRDATAYTVPLDLTRVVLDLDLSRYTVPLDSTAYLVSSFMAVATHVKDPQAIRDYQLDWSTYLNGADTISSASWSVSPSGPTIVSSSNTTTTTKARVSGGTAGAEYTLTCHVVLASGQEDDRSITIQVADQ